MYKAYLFDCDGTLADSMPVHYLAWQAALQHWGATFSEEQFYSSAGMSTAAIVELLNREQGLQMAPADVLAIKEKHYFAYLPEVQAVPEMLEQIQLHHGRAKLAVVSGSPRFSVERTLTALHLLDRFDLIVTAEDYLHGKPAPDCYLLAAQSLGVAPSECLVFEDAELGLESARRAGMDAVRVIPESQRFRNLLSP
jgi:HAD superfamily hydrolase (TIGR01509 family)